MILIDQESSFSTGVSLIAETLERGVADPSLLSDAWIQAADTYQSMWGGMGSLTDLYIYGEDAEAIGDEYGELVKALNPFFERATCA